jgi:hypothetical protein
VVAPFTIGCVPPEKLAARADILELINTELAASRQAGRIMREDRHQSLRDSWAGLERLARSAAGGCRPAHAWANGPSELAGEGDELADVLERDVSR